MRHTNHVSKVCVKLCPKQKCTRNETIVNSQSPYRTADPVPNHGYAPGDSRWRKWKSFSAYSHWNTSNSIPQGFKQLSHGLKISLH